MHTQVAKALQRMYEKFLAPMEDWRNDARDSPPQPEAAEAVAIEHPASQGKRICFVCFAPPARAPTAPAAAQGIFLIDDIVHSFCPK